MENADIMKIILAVIVGIVSAFSKVIFDKIFSAYNPDPKRINSGIKNFFSFIFSYILPIVALILLYMKSNEVDKFFILSSSFLFSAFFFNVLYSILLSFMNKLLFDKEKSVFNNISTILKDNIELSKDQNEALLKLTKAHEDHLNVTSEIIKNAKRMTEN